MWQKFLKIPVFLTFALSLTFLACTSENGQNGTKDDTITGTPKEEINPEELTYQLPESKDYVTDKEMLLIEKFYPIGWSPDGKFAYITEPADEATGFYFFNFRIQDMVTDKIVWEWKIDVQDQVMEGNLQSTWDENKELFTKQLRKHKIVQQNSFQLNGSQFTENGNEYKIETQINKKMNELFGLETIAQIKVNLSSSALGQKTIYSMKDDESLLIDAEIGGYIKNPYEPRIAVIHYGIQRGYEGPPNTVHIKLSGAALEEGFK